MAKVAQDIKGVLRGMQMVVEEGLKLQNSFVSHVWKTSTIRESVEQYATKFKPPVQNPSELIKSVSESLERGEAVLQSVRGLASTTNIDKIPQYEESPIKFKSATYSPKEGHEVKLTPKEKEILDRIEKEYITKMNQESVKAKETEPQASKKVTTEEVTMETPKPVVPKARPSLSSVAKERTVPSSRIARMVSFGSLAAGLGVGTAAEMARRTLGFKSEPASIENMFLTPANMDRIVNTLCKVRGAALKIGQLISLQDETLVSPQLSRALERVRQSADFMPEWQIEKVMKEQLGADWRSRLAEFEMQPFAAASIGQVHWAKLHDGTEVAVKIQYPGVAKGITSDIDNLMGIMKLWNIFPEGMFVDNLVAVAKRELAWEVDYVREAECTKKFRELLKPYPEYYVPRVIDDLCSKEVFTTEFVEGVPVDKCFDMDVKVKEFITMKSIEMILREILQFQYMQTDPNWSNFLYDKNTHKIVLLDFGASQGYKKSFIDYYARIMRAAADNDRKTVLRISQQMGFLTGYESAIMEEAHVDAVMVFGEVFRSNNFDFGAQKTTQQILYLVPTMLKHRLKPPPEEIYSIHRKLSGIFLLCSKMKVTLPIRPMFEEIYSRYKYDTVLD